MWTDTQMMGKHLGKLCVQAVLVGRHLLEIQNRRALKKKRGLPCISQTEGYLAGISSASGIGNFLLPAPPKCGKSGKDFYLRTAPGIHSICPVSCQMSMWVQPLGSGAKLLRFKALCLLQSSPAYLQTYQLAHQLALALSFTDLSCKFAIISFKVFAFFFLCPHLLSSWSLNKTDGSWSTPNTVAPFGFYPLKAHKQTTLFIF